MQSGYILFDGTGIDLNVATEVTIAEDDGVTFTAT